MTGMLAPEQREETIGTAEIRTVFVASKIGTVAGSMVTAGVVRRGARFRLLREQRRHLHRRGRVGAADEGRRPRGRGRLRVRHQAEELQRHQGEATSSSSSRSRKWLEPCRADTASSPDPALRKTAGFCL